MSSDESVSTTISSVSSRNKETKAKSRKPEKWEIDLIGNFLLNLYHTSFITNKDDWCVQKAGLRKEFIKFSTAEQRQKLKKLNGTDNVGSLLDRCGFIINTARGSDLYKIRCKNLFDFRNNKLEDLDKQKINHDALTYRTINRIGFSSDLNLNTEEIDENEPKKALQYQGSTMQERVEGFLPTNMCCFICQSDFSTMELLEEHIQMHGDDTDFEFLKELDKFNSPFFTISYRLCKNSHNFCFEIESSLDNLIIEKIIIVQSRSFFYVHNMRVPYKYPESGIERFFVDSHLFTKHLEQPIVILCHLEDSKKILFIEQHHFMRTEDFPKVCFAINPNRLPSNKLFEPKFKLAQYFPPKEIQNALKDDFYHQSLMKNSNEFRDYIRNEKKLQPQTIGASLNILLQIEDMDTMQQYFNLKQKKVNLRSFGGEYSFQLKPSQRVFLESILSPFDEVILTTRTDILTSNEKLMQLTLQNTSDIHRVHNNTYVGQIQAINTGRISFKCDKIIDINASYAVAFRPSRMNFRYQYRALELLPNNIEFLKKFLFPAKIVPMALPTTCIELYNKNLNEEQLQAVRNIALGPRNDATYIIFGPPGTGKTTTLAEGILQLLRKPNTKILVTAASNSACDEVAIRLCQFLNHLDMARCLVRIYSRSCEVRIESIDEILLENSNMYNGQFYPDVEVLHNYRVVICTLSVVAKLATGKFGRQNNGDGVYTHLLIDEVAAAMESEALLAITTILTRQSSLIISGDHKQLGPVLKSMRAKELGLDASLMDRLMVRDCYRIDDDTGDYDRTIQTRLTRNYRSHPAIVRLYSGLYYNHSLEPCAKREHISLCEKWHKLHNKEYPILFHAIYGPSKADRQSHSLFNFTEVMVVMDYVKDLLFFGVNGQPVKESDIGIISPYKKQYQYIKEELNLRKWFGIETGSVETFQGKEKSIIIVSFVRSGTEQLGFLDSPRRLNVTLSRPKCILILVGNPITLSLHKDFEYIIKECKRNNTFVGSHAPPKSDLKQKMSDASSAKSHYASIQLKKDTQHHHREANQRREQIRGAEKAKDRKLKPLSDVADLVALSIGKKSEQNKNSGKSGKSARRRDRDRNRARNRNRPPDANSNRDKKYDESEDDDDFDSKSQASNISKKSNSNRNSEKDFASKAGINSKVCAVPERDRNAAKQNTNQNQKDIDLILNELPQVPKTPVTTFTKEQLLLLKNQQQQYVQNLQLIPNLHPDIQKTPNLYQNYNSPNPYYNLPHATNIFRPTAPPNTNPFRNQQPQQIFNTHTYYPTHMNMTPGFQNNIGLPNYFPNIAAHPNNNANSIPKSDQQKQMSDVLNKTKANAGNFPLKKSENLMQTNPIAEKPTARAANIQSKQSKTPITTDAKISQDNKAMPSISMEAVNKDRPLEANKAGTWNDCSDFISLKLREEMPSSAVRIFSKLAATKAKLQKVNNASATNATILNRQQDKPTTSSCSSSSSLSLSSNIKLQANEPLTILNASTSTTKNSRQKDDKPKTQTAQPSTTLAASSGTTKPLNKLATGGLATKENHFDEISTKRNDDLFNTTTTSHNRADTSPAADLPLANGKVGLALSYKSPVNSPATLLTSPTQISARDPLSSPFEATNRSPSLSITSSQSGRSSVTTTYAINTPTTSNRKSADRPAVSAGYKSNSGIFDTASRSSTLTPSTSSSTTPFYQNQQTMQKNNLGAIPKASPTSGHGTTSSASSMFRTGTSSNATQNSNSAHSWNTVHLNHSNSSSSVGQPNAVPVYEERGRTSGWKNTRKTETEQKSCILA